MKRRDFIKVFSAGTTLAAATSLADIIDAKPVINNLESKIILPGDKEFNVDWVFDYVGYFRHKYSLSNEFEIGVDVSDSFDEVIDELIDIHDRDRFKFTFKLKDYYYFRYGNPGLTPDPLYSYIEEFLESHIFDVSINDLISGEQTGYDDSTRILTIYNARVIENITDV